MIILPGRTFNRRGQLLTPGKLLMSVPESDWREPSQRPGIYQRGGHPYFILRCVIRATRQVVWRGLFIDRRDVDEFMVALFTGSILVERELWDLPLKRWVAPHNGVLWNPPDARWDPALRQPGLSYELANFIPLTTTSASAQNWTVVSDWNNANNTINAIGTGGNGTTGTGGNGGGGAAWADLVNTTLTPGNIQKFFVNVNTTTSGATGPDAWIRIDAGTTAPASTAQGTLAKGGAGSTGGSSASSIGTNKAGGGNGGVGNGVSSIGGAGGAGGPGGAGTGSAGAAGGTPSGGSSGGGAGGGGNGGGTAGGVPAGNNGSNGGDNRSSTGHGVGGTAPSGNNPGNPGTAGTVGGGGGGGSTGSQCGCCPPAENGGDGGNGGNGIDFADGLTGGGGGPGAGGAGAGGSNGRSGVPALYGSGSAGDSTMRAAGQGIVFIVNTPVVTQKGSQIYDTPVQTPRAAVGWTASYNRNLVNQDKLPAGKQSYDRAPPAIGIPAGQTWTWSYNQNLIGKDKLPPGAQRDTLPPPGPPPIAWPRTFTGSYNLNLIGRDVLPAGEQRFELAPIGPLLPQRSWTWSYLLTLIGKDALPVGAQRYDLPPPGYPPVTHLRSWTWSYNLNLVAQDKLPPGEQSFERPPPGPIQFVRSWAASYNLNLIGADTLPVGKIVYDLPPRGPPPLVPSWTSSYLLELIAQDQLPPGEQLYDTPKGYIYSQDLRTWTQDLAYQLFVPPKPFGGQFTDPVPTAPYRAPTLSSWIDQTKLLLIGQDKLPAGGLRYTDLPNQGPVAPQRSYHWYAPIAFYPTPPPIPPGTNYDWPNPQIARASVQLRTWAWSYNLNLIGKDALPPGDQAFDRPPLGIFFYVQAQTTPLNFLVVTAPVFPAAAELPRAREYPTQLRTFAGSPAALLASPAPPLGRAYFDRPAPRDYPPALRTAIGTGIPLLLRPVNPAVSSYYATPAQPLYPVSLRTGVISPRPAGSPPRTLRLETELPRQPFRPDFTFVYFRYPGLVVRSLAYLVDVDVAAAMTATVSVAAAESVDVEIEAVDGAEVTII